MSELPTPEQRQRQELKQAVEEVVQGLLYPSESDEPFVWIELPGAGQEPLDLERLRTALGLKPSTPLEWPDTKTFWEALDAEPRFTELRATLEGLLGQLWICRAGSVEVSVYILGRHGEDLVGLKTLSVET